MLAREQQERQRLEQLVVQMQIENESRGTIQAYLEESGVEVHVIMQALRRSGMSAAQLLDFLVAVENAPGMRYRDRPALSRFLEVLHWVSCSMFLLGTLAILLLPRGPFSMLLRWMRARADQ